MKTAFAQIVSAVIDALKAEPAVCDRIDRARAVPAPEQAEQAVSVQWETALPDLATIAGQPIDWKTRITVDCLARSLQQSGDLAVDDLVAAVAERLAQDTTLGGLVFDLRIAGLEAENSVEGKKTGWVRLTYIADHRTDNGILN
ncbi:hypothetical protein [Massilia aerilata]|uniref:DUF3168 domain-containing protein n=1 Tax=Massilia aerilata TaxID=453817 RepID=A0ABW0RYT4_9BURK